MRAMILAAGFGTRLRPLTDKLPKPLVPVAGIPNIELVITHLKRHGIREMVVNLHHLADEIPRALGDGSSLGVSLVYSREDGEILGTGGGIKKALPLLGDEAFAVVNGDVLFTPDLDAAIATHRKNGALATLVVRPDPEAERYGPVGLDDAGKIRRLVWAGTREDGPRTHMFTGVHIIEPRIADLLPDNGCIVRETYIPLVEKGAPLFGSPDDGYFCDLGTPDRLLAANSDLLTGRAKIEGFSAPPNGVHISPNAVLGTGCTVDEGTSICGGAIIGAGVTVSRSIVMDGANLRSDTDLSLVFDGGVITPD